MAEFCLRFLRISLRIGFGKINDLTEVEDEPQLVENYRDDLRLG